MDAESLKTRLDTGADEIVVSHRNGQRVAFCNYNHSIVKNDLGDFIDHRLHDGDLTEEELKDHWYHCLLTRSIDGQSDKRINRGKYDVEDKDVHSDNLFARVMKNIERYGASCQVRYYVKNKLFT